MSYRFADADLNLAVKFGRPSTNNVIISQKPRAWIDKAPVFLPTRELLTIYPGFVSLYDTTHTQFEETWRDTCVLLGKPLTRGPREETARHLLEPLEKALGGKVTTDDSGKFYLKGTKTGNIEMHLVAEGLRKLATIARLIANGALLDKGCLFWDEPEANLNPRIIRDIARVILEISKGGVQVVIATHSLFLLRELYIQQKYDFPDLDVQCFGLHRGDNGAVNVQQGKTMDDIGDITALDEELQQSDRYLNVEMGLPPDAQPTEEE